MTANHKKMRKGGSFFSVITAVFFAIILVTAFVGLKIREGSFKKNIGERQYSLIRAYQDAEKSLVYLDQSARYAAEQAVYDMAKKGTDSGCGTYQGYPIWVSAGSTGKAKECYPETIKLKEDFKGVFDEKLNSYIVEFNQISSAAIPPSNYDFALSDEAFTITGTARESIDAVATDPDYVKSEIATWKEEAETEKKDYALTTAAQKTKNSAGANLVKVTGVSCSGTCMLTDGANKLLQKANEEAKKQGFEIEVKSSYRSLERQMAIWKEGVVTINGVKRKLTEKEKPTYICNPNPASTAYDRCPHLSGGAVDVTIKKKTHSQMTSYDWKRLQSAMYSAGWVRYANEDWHFEYGTPRYARAVAANANAIV